jgi:hypothetical protein
MAPLVRDAAPRVDRIASTPEGRAAASVTYAGTADHISADLLPHLIRGADACDSEPLISFAERERRRFDPEHITCPVRLVRGTDDQILNCPPPRPASAPTYPRPSGSRSTAPATAPGWTTRSRSPS